MPPATGREAPREGNAAGRHLREMKTRHHSATVLRSEAALSLSRAYGNQFVQRALIARQGGALTAGKAGAKAGSRLVAREGGKAGTKVKKSRWERIETILKAIPTGQEALRRMKKYKVTVKFKTGKGRYYDPGANEMVLDTKGSDTRAALSFVHEMNHALYKHKGWRASIRGTTRADYVKKKVTEEAEGAIKSIEAKIELEGTKISVKGLSYPQEKEYRKAFNDAVEAATKKDPKASAEDLKRIGRKAGKKRVIKGYMEGAVVTSNTKETYPDYYGKAWDKANKKKGK